MGLYYKDGHRVSGCRTQLVGAIIVIGLLIITMWASDNGIDLLDGIWTVIKWGILVSIIVFIVIGNYASIKEKKEQQEREKKEQQEREEKKQQ